MKPSTFVTIAVLLAGSAFSALAQTDSSLQIYVVDVEGGNATLFVTPSGESVLIDTGNVAPQAAARDAGRIIAATQDAGLTEIDHLITTHWHNDHFGGMSALAAQIPIRNFIDHGSNTDPRELVDAFLDNAYPALIANAKRTIVAPGDEIEIAGLEWNIVAARGDAITSALPGAGQANPYCADFVRQEDDPTENARSVGSVVSFGEFRVAHLGDLTWNKEFDLMCPINRVGVIDLFIVSHHGQPSSNSEVLTHAIEPQVGIINNGTRKGGQPEAMKVLHTAPGLEDIWQMHFSQLSGQEYTQPGMFIANLLDDPLAEMPVEPIPAPPRGPDRPLPPQHNGPANWIKVSAQEDGSFSVTNQRNGFTKFYNAR
jgi:competence protein ComEC